MKKSLCFLIGLFILFSFNCYAGEALTAQQKEAEVWYEKAYSVDTPALKIEYYSKAIEINPKHAVAYNNRGAAFNTLGEYQKAIDDYNKAIEINPKHAVAYNNRGAVFKNLGEYQKAIDDYTKSIELNPKLAATYNNRGHAYAVQKASTAACGDFYQAGILFLKQNNTTQALICVDWIKKINPSSPLINKFVDQINK